MTTEEKLKDALQKILDITDESTHERLDDGDDLAMDYANRLERIAHIVEAELKGEKS